MTGIISSPHRDIPPLRSIHRTDTSSRSARRVRANRQSGRLGIGGKLASGLREHHIVKYSREGKFPEGQLR
jgi:hypothetical protein